MMYPFLSLDDPPETAIACRCCCCPAAAAGTTRTGPGPLGMLPDGGCCAACTTAEEVLLPCWAYT